MRLLLRPWLSSHGKLNGMCFFQRSAADDRHLRLAHPLDREVDIHGVDNSHSSPAAEMLNGLCLDIALSPSPL
jgi:hypothetical protein